MYKRQVYEKGYLMLLGRNIPGSYLRWCDILGVLVVVLISVSMWGMEEWYGTDVLCRSTKYGLKSINKRKMILNVIYGIIVAVIIYVPWIVQVSKAYQVGDMGAVSYTHLDVYKRQDQKEVQTAMNKYELALVVNAKIEDDARVATVEKAKEYVTKFGGNITNVEEWGKKKLAYEIQHMKEGFYYFIQFDAEADVPAQLEQAVRIMDNVLRYLCVRQEA